jgi:hypothetical protein
MNVIEAHDHDESERIKKEILTILDGAYRTCSMKAVIEILSFLIYTSTFGERRFEMTDEICEIIKEQIRIVQKIGIKENPNDRL